MTEPAWIETATLADLNALRDSFALATADEAEAWAAIEGRAGRLFPGLIEMDRWATAETRWIEATDEQRRLARMATASALADLTLPSYDPDAAVPGEGEALAEAERAVYRRLYAQRAAWPPIAAAASIALEAALDAAEAAL